MGSAGLQGDLEPAVSSASSPLPPGTQSTRGPQPRKNTGMAAKSQQKTPASPPGDTAGDSDGAQGLPLSPPAHSWGVRLAALVCPWG